MSARVDLRFSIGDLLFKSEIDQLSNRQYIANCRLTPVTTDMTAKTVTVTNRLGMHARAAARFVHMAATFQSAVKVAHDHRVMDGKSIMGILLLAAARGSVITISAEGADEQAAVDALCGLVESGFGEDTCTV